MALTDTVAEELQRAVQGVLPGVRALRQDLHAHPEIALHEKRTAACVRDALRAAGLAPWPPLLDTDVIAELPGADSRTTICLRADMDALPIDETTDCTYRSTTPGMAHSCGHDGHTAMLVGAARVLAARQGPLPVNVRFVFQPGEEIVAAGRDLVARGACDGVSAAYALHGWPGLPVGVVAGRSGPVMAAAAFFSVQLTGSGCHGSTPECGNSPLTAAAEIVQALERLHADVQAEDGSVVSVCSLRGGQSANVIPERCRIEGTVRYLEAARGAQLEQRIRAVITQRCDARSIQADLDYTSRYALPTINSEAASARARSLVQHHLGSALWHELTAPSMSSEDFAYYLEGREGAMLRLGMGEESPSLHNPAYNFNDDALANGIFTLCALALAGA
ncbi:MAG: amidohydrolase [Verrucomicrobia bacterium]|jgi:amidohydrolase|nr:amidohydrolase [Verrucomicrobiota bacterium]MBT7068322.1 amidohydrolase [Verrucomicrobiota bacterium]MBT7699931.1 amidohydrolase [Verrucomicrobiota bacterium]